MGGDGALGMVVFLGGWCSWDGGVLGRAVPGMLGINLKYSHSGLNGWKCLTTFLPSLTSPSLASLS